MSRRSFRRPTKLICLAWIFLLAACQTGANPGLPSPTPIETTPAMTLPPLASPAPTFTLTPETPDELNISPVDLKGLEVKFWHPLAGEAAELLEAQARLFNFSNQWGVRVTLQATGSAGVLEDAVGTGVESELPDVVLAPSELLAAWDEEKEFLADLSFYLEDETWGLAQAERTGYDPRFWNQDRAGDKQLGLPALRTAVGLMYNRSFAADLGFPAPPTSPQELLVQACASAKDNNRFYPRYGTGGWILDTRPISALSWLTAFGAQVEPEGTDPAWHFDQPEARDTLAFLHEMQAAGCVWIPKYPTPQTYFSGRLAFLYTATLQDLISQQGTMTAANSKDEWTMIPFPARAGRGFVYTYGYSYAVVRSSARLDPAQQLAAWLFVRWMSAKERLLPLAEAWPSLPVRMDVRAALEAKKDSFPWTVILPLADAARPAPAQPSWRLVRRPLEDAFWQTFHLASKEQLDTILPMLDSMAADLMNGP